MKKIVFLAFVLMLLSTAVVIRFVKPVEASGTIFIKADGSVVPDTAPISTVDNVTYTLTDNIYDGIVVEKDNIVVDGAGYTLQFSGTGIDLAGRRNVTVKNIEIKAFDLGIHLKYSSYNTISGNHIANNYYGVWFLSSSNNSVYENNIANNEYGIYIYDESSNNTIYHNNFVGNTYQVYSEYHGSTNVWDNGYPSGGNYWSDYEERYPDATEIDNSGIWDTPYVIDENNQDNYPIVPEFPSFLILPLFMAATLVAVTVYGRKCARQG